MLVKLHKKKKRDAQNMKRGKKNKNIRNTLLFKTVSQVWEWLKLAYYRPYIAVFFLKGDWPQGTILKKRGNLGQRKL